jgi:hypothetical protein
MHGQQDSLVVRTFNLSKWLGFKSALGLYYETFKVVINNAVSLY